MSQVIEILRAPLLKGPALAGASVAGRASIASGSSTVDIANVSAAADSIINLTIATHVASHKDMVAVVSSINPGTGFTIQVQKASVAAVPVCWWLVRAS